MNHTRWLRHYWAITVILALGIVTATGLAATGPVLVDQVLTFAFRRVLLNTAVPDGHLLLTVRKNVDEADFVDLNNLVQSTATAHLADIPHTLLNSGTLPTLIPWQGEELLTEQRLNVRFYDEAWRERVTIVAGDWPQVELPDANVVAVVIGEPTAVAYNLNIGDRLPLSKQPTALEAELWLEVAAIVQPIDGQDPFWYGELSPLRVRDDGRFLQYNALISRDTFFTLAANFFPEQSASFAWPVLIEPNGLTLGDIPILQDRLATLPDQLFQADPQIQLNTGLPSTVGNFAQQADDVRTPLTFLTATTALLAFFFVAMAAAMAAVRLRNEWDLLRSRGVGIGRLLGQQAIRTVFLILPAILLGGGLAWLLLRGLSVAGPLAAIREPDWTVVWPTAAWTAALVAAIACALVMLWPFVGLSRQPIASHLQEVYRPENASWWQRYYVDVILMAAGLILLGRFVSGGGLIALQDLGEGADWLLVLAPIAAMFGSMAILLRLFPPLLNAISHFLGRWPQAVPFLALAYSARSHRQATRLVMLFALTVALGIFAASVDDALTHNELDRAAYATGGGVRLLGSNVAVAPPDDQITAVTWRGNGSFNSPINGRYPDFDILAIDPDSFLQLADLRPDFASEPIEGLVGNMHPPTMNTGLSLPIPPTATNFSLWFSMPTDDPAHWAGISFDIKVADERDNVFLIPLEPTGDTDDSWRRYAGDLPTPPPSQLKSIWLRSRTYKPEFRENMAFDDITVTDANGEEILIDGFEAANLDAHEDIFWFRVNREDTTVYFVPDGFGARSGNVKLVMGTGLRGLRLGEWYGMAPVDTTVFEAPVMPVLVSKQFAELTAVTPGDELLVRVRQSAVHAHNLLVRVVGIVDYFPTMYEGDDAGFIVMLREPLLRIFNDSRHEAMLPNELLLATTPSPEVVNQAAEVIELTAVQRALRAFPLAVGLRSASLLGYILATVISLGGFAAHLVFIISQRRSQFAVLRAIGWDSNQLYGLLLLEQMVLVLSGLILGTGLGVLLAWLTLNNLNFDWGGLAAAPPFVVVWDWMALLRTYGLFMVTVLMGLGTAVLIIRRTGLQQALSVAVE